MAAARHRRGRYVPAIGAGSAAVGAQTQVGELRRRFAVFRRTSTHASATPDRLPKLLTVMRARSWDSCVQNPGAHCV
jgi:shikimate 5-dehydrogenase